MERLRCRHCETIVEAEIPKDVGTEKYDSTVIPWLAYSRYRLGVPMYRLALSQELFGIPLPVQTQYMHLKDGAVRVMMQFGPRFRNFGPRVWHFGPGF